MGTLLTWQWSRRWSLTPSTKRVSHRGSLLKGGLFRSAVSKHIKCKVDWKEEIWWRMCTINRDDRKLRILSSKADSNTWELHKSELKLESVHQESPCSDIFRKRATKPLLKQNIVRSILPGLRRKELDCCSVSKVLFSDESTFSFSFGNQGLESGWRVERHRI